MDAIVPYEPNRRQQYIAQRTRRYRRNVDLDRYVYRASRRFQENAWLTDMANRVANRGRRSRWSAIAPGPAPPLSIEDTPVDRNQDVDVNMPAPDLTGAKRPRDEPTSQPPVPESVHHPVSETTPVRDFEFFQSGDPRLQNPGPFSRSTRRPAPFVFTNGTMDEL